jgi:hypothetical protein
MVPFAVLVFQTPAESQSVPDFPPLRPQTMHPPRAVRLPIWLLGFLGVIGLIPPARGEIITLKTGQVLRGTVDKDNTVLSIFDADGLKRFVMRDTKVARIEPDAAEKLERFALEQPLEVHSGAMPPAAVVIEATPWDAKGRRNFAYLRPGSSKPIRMTQAINSLGPRSVSFRGIDGFWVSHMATSQVPREVVLGILGKVDPTLENERIRVVRFLIQAEWYQEALAELESLAKDFPSFEERKSALQAGIRESLARRTVTEAELRKAAQQPRESARLLRSLSLADAPSDLQVAVKNQLEQLEAEDARIRALADDLRELGKQAASLGLPDLAAGPVIADRMVELIEGLTEAPETARARLKPFADSRTAEPSIAAPERLALALSGWVAGPDSASRDLNQAIRLFAARDAIRAYIAAPPDQAGSRLEDALRALGTSGADPSARIEITLFEKIVQNMPAPIAQSAVLTPGTPAMLRVRDDPNPNEPTEYAALLPPEYHPLRSYPAFVVLHGNETPLQALAWLAPEAMRRGYILLAPEYNLRNERRDYRFTPSEHAGVTLAIRDAKRRFAIDSNRVFLVGQMLGGQMAWDYGLAHPDLFAGVAPISGLPAKYVWVTRAHAALVPLYIALGDLAPTESDLIFGQLAKPLIVKNYDVMYVEHYHRALEPFPEEAPTLFDWAAGRKRDPAPKDFEVVAAREGDDRFYGLVIREFARGRTAEPAVVDPLGRNLKPATLALQAKGLGSLLNITTSGVNQLDVWVPGAWVDPAKRFEIRVNRKTAFRGMVQPDFAASLEDLRSRGDRQQLYWFKIPVNLAGGPRG